MGSILNCVVPENIYTFPTEGKPPPPPASLEIRINHHTFLRMFWYFFGEGRGGQYGHFLELHNALKYFVISMPGFKCNIHSETALIIC